MSVLTEIKKNLPPKARLIAVSKLQSEEKIRELFKQGQKEFAENYVQEAKAKMQILSDLAIRWHFIGRIQKNKIKDLVGKFELLHSVDSLELAKALNEFAQKNSLIQGVLLQVNLAGEESKGGFSKQNLLELAPKLKEFSALRIEGLMSMPPFSENAEASRSYFKELSGLRTELRPHLPHLTELSMGTSQDYRVAIEEGATIIRLGTILFGARPSKA